MASFVYKKKPNDTIEDYRKLLSKEQQLGDKYVIIDKKWFEHWKRFVGLERSKEKSANDPGPIDFSDLVETETSTHSNEVQLRADAVEGNDFTFIPFELYKELKKTHATTGPEIIRDVVPLGQWDTVIETFLVPLRICESKTSRNKTKQIYRSRGTFVDDIKSQICNEFRVAPSSNNRLFSKADDNSTEWGVVDYQFHQRLDDIDLTKNAILTYDIKVSPLRLGSGIAGFFRSSTASYTPGLCGLSNLGKTCFMNSALQCLSNVPAHTIFSTR